jgi:hypothetical protein
MGRHIFNNALPKNILLFHTINIKKDTIGNLIKDVQAGIIDVAFRDLGTQAIFVCQIILPVVFS